MRMIRISDLGAKCELVLTILKALRAIACKIKCDFCVLSHKYILISERVSLYNGTSTTENEICSIVMKDW